jgi:hypothetical protein
MRKTFTVMTLIMALLISTMSIALANGTAADRATGDVIRPNDAGTSLWATQFDAHAPVVMQNNTREAKGSWSTARLDHTDYWNGTVSCARNEADGSFTFGGTIDSKSVAGWGTTNYTRFQVRVTDGEPDTLRIAVYQGTGDPCGEALPGWATELEVVAGNLVVHQ